MISFLTTPSEFQFMLSVYMTAKITITNLLNNKLAKWYANLPILIFSEREKNNKDKHISDKTDL